VATASDADAVLAKTLKRFVHDRNDCKGAVSAIGSAMGGFAGAFTGKGKSEKAYLVTSTPCKGGAGKHTLTIVGGAGGDTTAASIDVHEDTLFEIGDLDADGDNELLLVGHNSSQDGTTTVTARIFGADGGKLVPLFDFKEIAKSTCKDKSGAAESATISYRIKGTEMEFHAEKKPGICK
jgi:hypothetical protein